MLSLLVPAILIPLFLYLARRHWRATIGAGPTILIIGAIVITVFGVVKYEVYHSALRDYDQCFGRVERTQTIHTFDNEVVLILDEINREDFATRLREVLVEPLVLEDTCGKEPNFLTGF